MIPTLGRLVEDWTVPLICELVSTSSSTFGWFYFPLRSKSHGFLYVYTQVVYSVFPLSVRWFYAYIFSHIFTFVYSETRTNSIVRCVWDRPLRFYNTNSSYMLCIYKAHKRRARVLKQRAYNRCTCLQYLVLFYSVLEKDCCYKMAHCPNEKENTHALRVYACVYSNRWPKILFFNSHCVTMLYTACNGSYLH